MKQLPVVLVGIVLALCLVWFISQFDKKKDTPESEVAVMPNAETTKPSPRDSIPRRKAKKVHPPSDVLSFRQKLEEKLRELPTKDEVRSAIEDGNVHRHPRPLLKSAAIFGEIAKAIYADKSKIPEALNFYHRCALKEELANSIRALCLRNLQDWSQRTPQPTRIDLTPYPTEVRRISKKIPQTH